MKALLIVGFWNSGTTLLTRLLKQHPDFRLRRAAFKPNLEERKTRKILHKLGTDYPDFSNMEVVVKDGFIHHREPSLKEEQIATFQSSFHRAFSVRKGKMLLLKQPYMFYIPNLLNRFMDDHEVKYVIVLRNGYSQVVSKGYWKTDTDDPEEKLYVRAGFWKRSMDYYYEHWAGRDDVLTIRYENLCHSTSRTVKMVCDFAGIAFDPIKSDLPRNLVARMDNWEKLPASYKDNVRSTIQDMIHRMDTDFPIWHTQT